jgi:hypothetical protein
VVAPEQTLYPSPSSTHDEALCGAVFTTRLLMICGENGNLCETIGLRNQIGKWKEKWAGNACYRSDGSTSISNSAYAYCTGVHSSKNENRGRSHSPILRRLKLS